MIKMLFEGKAQSFLWAFFDGLLLLRAEGIELGWEVDEVE
ncbi:hypothetical protein SAMN04487936_1108 [Halobacillus dabanensis]|uniref:Uncharacterized protein n=1 Tax=Halobacillus dabanensis TaxID=240302 RepID=A0A1I3Y2R8_HALDA|nr:hypothetical protein SAMN04487936_1108 [Halobacillus dabanensis]